MPDFSPVLPQLVHCHLGRCTYRFALSVQSKLAEALRDNRAHASEALLTLEHEPVFTIGRRGSRRDVLISRQQRDRLGIELCHADRGGEVTYHGPGQLVIYPILRIDSRRLGVADLVRGLSDSLIELLEGLGVRARYDSEQPGLWVGDEKIGAVGMRVTRGVSTHGAALNIHNDLRPFEWIVPCGLPHCRVTSVLQQRGEPLLDASIEKLAGRFARIFTSRLSYRLVEGTLDALACWVE